MRRPASPIGMPLATAKRNRARIGRCVPFRVGGVGFVIEFSVGILFATAVGFTFAGIGASGYMLFADERLSFASPETGGPMILPRVLLLLVSGPMVLVRNIRIAAARGLRPRSWLVLSALVASTWSFCTGLAILNLAALLNGAHI